MVLYVSAGIHLTWHEYCLDAYRVASGQKPTRILPTMCAGPTEELAHRLGIAAARALGPDALRRAFTIGSLRWLCHDCHRGTTVLDRRIRRYLKPSSLDWRGALRVRRLQRTWAGILLASLCAMDAGGDVQHLRNVRTAA